CVAGIIAGWVYQKPLTERTTTVFGRVERPLDVAIRSLRQVNTSLDRARANLKTIQETHGPAAPPPTETNFFRRMAVPAAAKELSPQIGNVRQTLNTVAEAAVVLNSVLDDVNDLPGGSLPSLDQKKLVEIRDRLSGIDSSAQELDAMLSDGPPGGVGEK